MAKTKKENLEEHVFTQIETLIKDTRSTIATTINSELVMLYWNVGKTINNEVLNNEKAEYGESIIKNVAKRLATKYGSGFSKPNIYRMVSFSNKFCDYKKNLNSVEKIKLESFCRAIAIVEGNVKEKIII